MSRESKPNGWPRWIVVTGIFAYCAVFLVRAPQWTPTPVKQFCAKAQGFVLHSIRDAMAAVAGANRPRELDHAVFLLLMAGIVPLVFSLACRRTLSDVGMRMPNRLALRYFLIAVVLATPFLVWMVQSPTIAGPYLNQWKRLGMVAFCGYYLVNMLTEHLFLHGIVLGLTRPDGRWADPAAVPDGQARGRRILRWLGMANSRLRETGWSTWLGLPVGCWLAMVCSALLFGMVHLGKDTRELVLSFPGGLLQAYVACRSNSWLTPFVIHLATALAALLMMMR